MHKNQSLALDVLVQWAEGKFQPYTKTRWYSFNQYDYNTRNGVQLHTVKLRNKKRSVTMRHEDPIAAVAMAITKWENKEGERDA